MVAQHHGCVYTRTYNIHSTCTECIDSLTQSSKPVGTLHLLNCQRVFDSKTRGLQFSYCLGLEIGETTHYIKADTSHSFNSWLEVLCTVCIHA